MLFYLLALNPRASWGNIWARVQHSIADGPDEFVCRVETSLQGLDIRPLGAHSAHILLIPASPLRVQDACQQLTWSQVMCPRAWHGHSPEFDAVASDGQDRLELRMRGFVSMMLARRQLHTFLGDEHC